MGAPKGNKFAAGGPGGGRPSSYKPAYVDQAKKACEAGFTDVEVGKLFGVSEVTINEWKLAHKEFCLALKSGKTAADDRMERSFYQRGLGYDYESKKTVKDNTGFEQVTKTTQHVPGDVGAQFRWLSNRRPEVWRERHEVDVSGKIENVFTLNIFEQDLSDGGKVIEGEKSVPRLRAQGKNDD
jgi:hypothetical protein